MKVWELGGIHSRQTPTLSPAESYRGILAAVASSRQAEVVANGTVSELSRAQARRRVAERALRQQGTAFRRGTVAERKSLRELQKQVMGLSVASINEKVRAGPVQGKHMGRPQAAGGLSPCVAMSCCLQRCHHCRFVAHPGTGAVSKHLVEEPCARTMQGHGIVVAQGAQGHCPSRLEP